jgi:hypothetical protein
VKNSPITNKKKYKTNGRRVVYLSEKILKILWKSEIHKTNPKNRKAPREYKDHDLGNGIRNNVSESVAIPALIHKSFLCSKILCILLNEIRIQ